MPTERRSPVQSGIVGVVLAAGRAQRFGADKRWATCRGEPLLAHALTIARAVCDRVLVVVDAPDARLDALLGRLPAEVVVCPEAGEGLAASRRCALARLERDRTVEGALIFLGDMPDVRSVDALRLIRAMRVAGRPVRPVHDDRPGHPVACPAAWISHLAARGFPAREGKSLRCVHPGVVTDVDRPGDLHIHD
ncbi:nucleotidyltransferase family protein [Guyparkeria hydrothermalis]|uniref:nucleotidyltransferase family protein n=1 Tax=Guyparkeria hydrothermalis TaxID=923 RepID=UPI0020207142|nr:nucleotidyltransferase family protein [Guyparkeria hydrothermalis]MCL7745147.1 nucleotidyltransferase family protein [Guyparkeria hydrothermalis]